MWEYLIGYADARDDAPCAVEEREWPDRAAMVGQLGAEGWELFEDVAHRPNARRIVFRRAIDHAGEPPRHLIPCW